MTLEGTLFLDYASYKDQHAFWRQGFLSGEIAEQVRRVNKVKEKAFVTLECQGIGNDLHRIRQLQQEQLVYGPYALIPDTAQTYEEVIQSLVAENLRQQYETRRERKVGDLGRL